MSLSEKDTESLKVILKEAGEAHQKAAADAAEKAIEAKSKDFDDKFNAFQEKVDKIQKMIPSFKNMGISESESRDLCKPELKAEYYRGIATNYWADGSEAKKVFDEYRAYSKNKTILAGDGSSGMSLIPTEYSSSIIELIRENDVLSALGVTSISPSRAIVEFPKIVSGSKAYMVGEGQKREETDVGFGKISLRVHEAAAQVYASKMMVLEADPSLIPVLESDLADALREKRMEMALYGKNVNNEPMGLFNTPGIKSIGEISTDGNIQAAANGDSPTTAFIRKLRGLVKSKYGRSSMKFLTNEDVLSQIATELDTLSGMASAVLSEDEKIKRVLNAAYLESGHVKADISRGSGTNLGQIFYGNWSSFMVATWWGGMTIEFSTQNQKAWDNNLYSVKACLPFDFAVRRPEEFAIAKFVKTINT